jgi:flagellar motility protein MotE (MotC chaperone)
MPHDSRARKPGGSFSLWTALVAVMIGLSGATAQAQQSSYFSSPYYVSPSDVQRAHMQEQRDAQRARRLESQQRTTARRAEAQAARTDDRVRQLEARIRELEDLVQEQEQIINSLQRQLRR